MKNIKNALNIRKVIKYEYDIICSKKNFLSPVIYSEILKKKTITLYDNGFPSIKEEIISSSERNVFEYDNKGRMIVERKYDNNGQLESISKYEYDEHNNLTKCSSRYKLLHEISKYESHIKYVYDDLGYLLKAIEDNGNYTTYHYNNYRQLNCMCEYNSKGKLSKQTQYTYNIEGQLFNVIEDGVKTQTRDYDNRGNLISNHTNSNGNLINYRFEYKYDTYGNCIEKIYYKNDIKYLIERFTIEYK